VTEVRERAFISWDGAGLGYRELGEGRTVILLHGFFSNGLAHWIEPGHAERLVAAGYRIVLPDLRGHGLSAGPDERDDYPADVLIDDGLALLEHLGVEDFDLGGYSLGGRTALRMQIRGARPARAVIAGMGLEGLRVPHSGREDRYRHVLGNLGTFEEGTLEWKAERHLRAIGGDGEPLLWVLDSSLPTLPEEIVTVPTPTRVLVGTEDDYHRSADRLAELLPDASFEFVPGSHTKAIGRPEIGDAILGYLGAAAG
jgi:pimeloyl-ACP methyl ester carboxylesterase